MEIPPPTYTVVILLLISMFSLLVLSMLKICQQRNLLKNSNDQLTNLTCLLSQLPNPVFQTDNRGTVCFTNETAVVFLKGLNVQLGEALPDIWMEELTSCISTGDCITKTIKPADRYLDVQIIPVTNPKVVNFYIRDITKERQKEQQLRLLNGVFEHTLEGIAIADCNGIIKKVNPSYMNITGFSAEEVVGKPVAIIKSGKHDDGFYLEIWKSLIENRHWQGEVWNRRKNGEIFPKWLSITGINGINGDLSHYVGVFHDMTEMKLREEKIEFHAYYDVLTDLPNRVLFSDRLNSAISHAKRYQQKLAVLVLDLDDFKHINDSLGHYIGDQLLKKVAQRLVKCFREEDTVARLGGDEFMMIIEEVKKVNDVVDIAVRIIASLSQTYFLEDNEIQTGASIGITIYPDDGIDINTLIKNADLAMYRAKDAGKSNYALFTKEMTEMVERRMTIEQNLRYALNRNEFQVYYQPKIDTRTLLITGTEALVRWNRPNGDLISPDDFIPLAEETGLILPLGQWVLKEACRQTKIWLDHGYYFMTVAVNLSAIQFQDRNLLPMVKQILHESGLPPEKLNLEITENILMMDVDAAKQIMRQLSELGIHISLDDFGTGYSSLLYLKQFPIDFIKIDKSFVKGLPHDLDDAAIAKTVLSLAKHLGLRVVAEGVETKEHWEFMLQNGCEEIQGFLFSKPLTNDSMSQLLTQGREMVLKSR